MCSRRSVSVPQCTCCSRRGRCGSAWRAKLAGPPQCSAAWQARCGRACTASPVASADGGPRELASIPGAFVSPWGVDAVPGEMVQGRRLEQRVRCSENGFAKVWLKIGTYGRQNRSHLDLVILDEGGAPLR